jgi:predicted dehydrogenase
MDISVVLDLMIHDIDLLIHMVSSPIKEVIADGISVISNNIDLANVKLIFKNGCVANLTASRISNKNMRKIRVFEKQTYTSIDLLNKEVLEYSADGNIEANELIFHNQKIELENQDALAAELKFFCNAIQNKNYDTVNINAAIDALEIALQINKIIHEKRKLP